MIAYEAELDVLVSRNKDSISMKVKAAETHSRTRDYCSNGLASRIGCMMSQSWCCR